MLITKNRVVSIDYTLTDDQGNVIDSSQGGEPLVYIHGVGNIIPGLEEALEGKRSGDRLAVSISPDKGYGERIEELTQTVAREQFAGIDELRVGMQFHTEGTHGAQVVTITAIAGDEVTVDGNHPLAGATLNFEVAIVNVRDAHAEELSHGHVHGEGGHHH